VPLPPTWHRQQILLLYNATLFDCPSNHDAVYARDGMIRAVGPLQAVLGFAAEDLGMQMNADGAAELTLDAFEGFLDASCERRPSNDDDNASDTTAASGVAQSPVDWAIVDCSRPGVHRKTPTVPRRGKLSHGDGMKLSPPPTPTSAFDASGGGDGLLVCPGFIDAHVHLLDAGRRKNEINLREVKTKEQFRHAVKMALKHSPPGTWLTGGDWDERGIEGGQHLDRTWLDDLAPHHPILLARFDSHSALVNKAAFLVAGIDVAKGEEIEDGVLERFDGGAGELSGIVREAAVDRIKKAFPLSDTESSMTTALVEACDELIRNGITGVHTMTSMDFANIPEVEFLENKARTMQLPIRVACAVREPELEWVKRRKLGLAATSPESKKRAVASGMGQEEKEAHEQKPVGAQNWDPDCKTHIDFGAPKPIGNIEPAESNLQVHRYDADRWVRVLGVKTFLDGSLGSRTACFLEPFKDRGGSGVEMVPKDKLSRLLEATDEAGVMLMAHAIGDGAVRRLLTALEDYANTKRPDERKGETLQLRVEHCQHVTDEDIERIRRMTGGTKKKGADRSEGDDNKKSASHGGPIRVIASMQPTHADSDCQGVEQALEAARIKEAYRFRTLSEAGAVLAFGSDWMVMPPRPVASICAATQPPKPFSEEEGISAADAIRALTIGPAQAARWDGHFGRIAPGYAADFTILTRDITHSSARKVTTHEELIAYTIIDCVVKYERETGKMPA
jgi:predicted amidohydrolase YtcJ